MEGKKLKDFFNVYKNKNNKQIKFELKKKMLKQNNIKVKDIMNLDIPLNKKMKMFEGI